jgi:hypothetical protein
MNKKKIFIVFLILAFLTPSHFLFAGTVNEKDVILSKVMTVAEMENIFGKGGGGGGGGTVRLSGTCYNPDQSSPMWHPTQVTYMKIMPNCANGQLLGTFICDNEYGAYSLSGQWSEYYSMYGEGKYYMNRTIYLKSPLRVYMTDTGLPTGKRVESRKISISTGY